LKSCFGCGKIVLTKNETFYATRKSAIRNKEKVMADTKQQWYKDDYSSIGDFIPSLQENGKIRRPARSPRQTVSQSGSRTISTLTRKITES